MRVRRALARLCGRDARAPRAQTYPCKRAQPGAFAPLPIAVLAIPAFCAAIPAFSPVIPAKAGIQRVAGRRVDFRAVFLYTCD